VVGLLVSGCSALLPPRNEVDEPRGAPSALAANPAPAVAATASVEGSAGWAEHRVQSGETLYSLARRHNVKPAQLAQANGLDANAGLKSGQSLRVPSASPQPASRDSAPAPVAAPRIAVARAELPAPNAAQKPPAKNTAEMQPAPAVQTAGVTPVAAQGRLVPAPRRAPLEAPIQGTTGPVADDSVEMSSGPALDYKPKPMAEQVAAVEPEPGLTQPARPAPPPQSQPPQTQPPAALRVPDPPARAASGFMRPVEGRVLVAYGSQPGGLRNDGINISAPRGAAVKAADNGVVVYAGNELRGFGNLLLVSHAGGWVTAYAHLDGMAVARGDKVARGQKIATVGMTGNVTQPQLHFEIRRGKQPVDPEQQLAVGAPQAAMRPPPVGAAQ
jgi:murein DD-endopeptidase MepM/ murein hydrolase activator NlpD